jgi:hypothetical protein
MPEEESMTQYIALGTAIGAIFDVVPYGIAFGAAMGPGLGILFGIILFQLRKE